MKSAPLPPDEAARLAALAAHDLLDTLPEQDFDDLTSLASRLCETPIALVSLVDRERQWFKSRVGLEAPETPRDVAYCSHTILGDDVMVVPDAFQDARFHDNPLATGAPHVRFYAGAPLRAESGHKLGTLCVIDHVPRELTPEQLDSLRRLGRQVEAQLRLRLRMQDLERREAEGRSQRDALGRALRQRDALAELVMKDLQVPLSGIQMNASFITCRPPVPDEVRVAARDIQESAESAQRMVANLMDAGREDSPMVPRLAELDVHGLVTEVAREFSARIQGSHRQFTTSVRVSRRFMVADRELLRRALDNLLDNSYRFTALGSGRVMLEVAQPEPDLLEVKVRDEGPGIPTASREHVFDAVVPEGTPTAARARASNALGLVFCRRAVQAHGGWCWVEENRPRGTVFCLRLPLGPEPATREPGKASG
ncbi:GAF domain-containing sensor histidine kinase [Pyxidicoccus fallax]|uniref:histidine kinase n=1 Tax=Pyxidicoccus fallax TaxID=394095 RepID=A0A848LHK1_9BACT|nr:GAF domain-containing sensor histidine kinase [Pyxidicoccus fallax]NMO16038.1 GAF domain-containing sensor histidine kinase [Pyxidicoccus fallax]NPC76949.1 GAF domain-containing sensor histidine kinase [Pyxidicoccus fallax]